MPFDGLKAADGNLYTLTSTGSSTGVVISANPAVLNGLFWQTAGSTAAVVTLFDTNALATANTTTDVLVIKGDDLPAGTNAVVSAVFSTGIVLKNEGGTPGTVWTTFRRI